MAAPTRRAEVHALQCPARIGRSSFSEACRKAGSHGPVYGAVAERVYPIGQRVALARVGVATSKHNGLQTAIQLWQSHLHTSSSCQCQVDAISTAHQHAALAQATSKSAEAMLSFTS